MVCTVHRPGERLAAVGLHARTVPHATLVGSCVGTVGLSGLAAPAEGVR